MRDLDSDNFGVPVLVCGYGDLLLRSGELKQDPEFDAITSLDVYSLTDSVGIGAVNSVNLDKVIHQRILTIAFTNAASIDAMILALQQTKRSLPTCQKTI